MRLLRRGAENRHVGETRLNRESSRSHSVFTCVIERNVRERVGDGAEDGACAGGAQKADGGADEVGVTLVCLAWTAGAAGCLHGRLALGTSPQHLPLQVVSSTT